jgi:hypothetical protein
MTEDVPAFAAALLLDPSRRAAYLRKSWPDTWVEPAIETAYALWEEENKAGLVLDQSYSPVHATAI